MSPRIFAATSAANAAAAPAHRMSSTKFLEPERFHRHVFVWVCADDAHVKSDPILRDWVELGRPLIVRRPCHSTDGADVCVGLSLPPSPNKRRLAFDLPRALVRKISEPPLWKDCSDSLELLQLAADAGGTELRTFGSHAWQHLTGLPYVTETSDIDLLLFLSSLQSWKIIRQSLEQIGELKVPGIDLEIVLSGDASFSWREFINDSPRLIFKGNARVWLGEKGDVSSYLLGK